MKLFTRELVWEEERVPTVVQPVSAHNVSDRVRYLHVGVSFLFRTTDSRDYELCVQVRLASLSFQSNVRYTATRRKQ